MHRDEPGAGPLAGHAVPRDRARAATWTWRSRSWTSLAREDADGPLAGDYLHAGAGRAKFYEMPKPRWESLHPILGLAELYWITGEEATARPSSTSGGASSSTTGTTTAASPPASRPPATRTTRARSRPAARSPGWRSAWRCCADRRFHRRRRAGADHCSTRCLGMHSPSGRWATYNTPMDGARFASAHDDRLPGARGQPGAELLQRQQPARLGPAQRVGAAAGPGRACPELLWRLHHAA